MHPQIADAFARLPDYLGGHVAVSLTALALGLALSLPLAVASMRRPGLRKVMLAFASVVQTIPGLALLALFYPLLLGIAALCERLFGAGFSALGEWTQRIVRPTVGIGRAGRTVPKQNEATQKGLRKRGYQGKG